MKKDFLSWFAKAKTRNQVLNEKAIAEYEGGKFVEPDVFDFEVFTGGKVGGSSTKAFVMLKGKYLSELYNEVKNKPDCNYVSCVNEKIKDCTWEEFKDFPVSIIGKKARYGDPDYTRAELIYSRLSNIFGLKTGFTIPLTEDYLTIASVDVLGFVPDPSGSEIDAEHRSQQIETFNELTESLIGRKSCISSWIRALRETIDKHQKYWQLSPEHIDTLIHDLIKIYMIRRYVFSDKDLHGENIGFVHSGDYKDLSIAPSIDMEFCGKNSSVFFKETQEDFEFQLKMDLAHLNIRHPQHLNSVIYDLKQVRDNNSEAVMGYIC